jgi:hypothetical protein
MTMTMPMVMLMVVECVNLQVIFLYYLAKNHLRGKNSKRGGASHKIFFWEELQKSISQC